MEQKQLDDLEDSFFGEEFIEDLEDLPPMPSKSHEIKIGPREEPAELRLRKTVKKASSPAAKKSAVKKSEKVTAVKASKETLSEEKPAAAGRLAEAKEHKEKKPSEAPAKKETVTVNIKPAKEAVKETKPAVETSSPVNPWEDDNNGSGLFKEVSTWKTLTGVVLVLLVLSLFTQGFNFSEKTAVTGAATATVTLQKAEQKVIAYVNTQLLTGAPFQAEVRASEELDTLYKITLAVAGQTVDSYVTKDGKLFFPQGFNLDEAFSGKGDKDSELSENAQPAVDEPVSGTESEEPEQPAEELEPKIEVEAPSDGEASVKSVELSLKAKKWVFQPNVLRVKKGSKVVLTVVPTGLDFTFAVPSLGVEKEVVGTTKVEFTADKAGTFDFICGSCENWRGMIGNLVVEQANTE